MTYEEIKIGQAVRIKVGTKPAVGTVRRKERQRYGAKVEQERVWVYTEGPEGVRICSPKVLEGVDG